jgi:hypothetical protein
MTTRQRAALLMLPDDEAAIVKHYSLSGEDMTAIDTARTPATRLGYALQLCCLRYPGRHLRHGELLPAVMLDHIAEQVGVDAKVIADFARRTPTRYDQLAAIKTRFGFSDLSRPHRVELRTWLTNEAASIIDGRALLGRLLDEMRARRIVIPGVSVVERMAAEAIHQAETDLVAAIDGGLGHEMRQQLDALIDDKVHDRQSRSVLAARARTACRIRFAFGNRRKDHADSWDGHIGFLLMFATNRAWGNSPGRVCATRHRLSSKCARPAGGSCCSRRCASWRRH